jgi:hypothetical protein
VKLQCNCWVRSAVARWWWDVSWLFVINWLTLLCIVFATISPLLSAEYNSILTFMEVVLCFLVMPTDMVNESGTWRRAASCVRVIMKRRLRRRPQQQVVGVCTGVFPVCVTGAATASPSLAALRFILIRTRGASRRRSAMSRPHHMDGQRLRSPLKLIHGNSSVSLRPAKPITSFFQMVFATETLCFQYRRDKNLYEPLGVIYAAMKCTYDTEEQCRRWLALKGCKMFRQGTRYNNAWTHTALSTLFTFRCLFYTEAALFFLILIFIYSTLL